MSEDNLLNDTASGIGNVAETAAGRVDEAVETAAGQVEEAAETVAGQFDEAVETAAGQIDGALTEMTEDAAEEAKDLNSDGEDVKEEEHSPEPAGPTGVAVENEIAGSRNIEKASKKTTVVLICTIVVLVAMIAVFAVLIARKYFENKNSGSGNNEPQVTSGASVPTDTPAATEEPSVTSSVTNDDDNTAALKEYDVTVELGQYKGLEIDFPEINITEEDVDNEIDYFIEELTEEVPVDRPAKYGDTLNIDYVGYMDGETFEGGSDEGVYFELGSGYFFDAFEAALDGKEVGQHTLELTFPENYYDDMAGKPVTFEVTINSITETVVPELTDQLIADNTECETIEEYRAFLKGELTQEAETEAEEHLERDILYLAIGNATFGGEIDQEIDDLTQQYFDYYDQMAQAYYGISGAELFNAFYGMTEEDYSATLREESSYSIKVQHLLDKVAEVENISYTEEEYKTEFEEIFFSYYGFTEEAEVREQLSDEEIDKVVIRSIKQKKAQDIIIDNAVINR